MGVTACEVACRYLADETETRTIVDPFCGRGTVLAVEAYNVSQIGNGGLQTTLVSAVSLSFD